MYKCLDCDKEFDTPLVYREDCTPGGSFEGGSFIQTYHLCPYCKGAIKEIEEDNNFFEEE